MREECGLRGEAPSIAPVRHGVRWQEWEEQKMLRLHFERATPTEIGKRLLRKRGGIESRLAQFGLNRDPFLHDGWTQLRLPLLMDQCGLCGRDVSSCTCDFGV